MQSVFKNTEDTYMYKLCDLQTVGPELSENTKGGNGSPASLSCFKTSYQKDQMVLLLRSNNELYNRVRKTIFYHD